MTDRLWTLCDRYPALATVLAVPAVLAPTACLLAGVLAPLF